MSEQLELFDAPPPAKPARVSKRFLSDNARIFDLLLESDTLKQCAAQAAKSTSRAHGNDRNTGGAFEDRFRELILTEDASAAITAETLADASTSDPDLGLEHVQLIDGPGGRALADIVLVARCAGARAVRIAVNIKRLLPKRNSTEGGSTLQFLQLATEPVYDPSMPPNPLGFDYELAVLEMLTLRRRIKDHRDYWLLVARVDAGTFTGFEAWGTMIGTRNDRTVVRRHPSRAVLEVHQPTGMLPLGVDPNLTLAESLLPRESPSALRAQIVAGVLARDGLDMARQLAETLLEMDDSVLLQRVVRAVTSGE